MGMALFPATRRQRAMALLRIGILLAALAGALGHATRMPGRSHAGSLPPLTEEESAMRDRMREDLRRLAGEIGERHIGRLPALRAAEALIEDAFAQAGYAPVSQPFEARGTTVRNIEIELTGTRDPDEIVVIGAHYDTVPGSPGANDNGSGVVALLEMARQFAGHSFPRTIRFVAFVNEEPPFYQTPEMGSWVYARRARERREDIVAMMSLETIGCYRDEPGTQQYPFPFNWFYPDTGNFIAFVGNVRSRRLVRRTLADFRSHTAFPSEGVAAFGFLPGLGWSDHWSFWRHGYPALMVTDTALFRYAHYHSPADTPDRVDVERMARVVAGLVRVARQWAGGEESDQ